MCGREVAKKEEGRACEHVAMTNKMPRTPMDEFRQLVAIKLRVITVRLIKSERVVECSCQTLD